MISGINSHKLRQIFFDLARFKPWILAEPEHLTRYGFLCMLPLFIFGGLFLTGGVSTIPVVIVQLFFLGAYTAVLEGEFDQNDRNRAAILFAFTVAFLAFGIVYDANAAPQTFHSPQTQFLVAVCCYKLTYLTRVLLVCRNRTRLQ
jgi:hypothetical protein